MTPATAPICHHRTRGRQQDHQAAAGDDAPAGRGLVEEGQPENTTIPAMLPAMSSR